LISAEAILLANLSGDAGYRGELRYRIALRASAALRSEADPAAVFRLFRSAYDARSAVAHGADLELREMRGLDGSRLLVSEFVVELSNVVHRLIRAVIASLAAGAVPNWDAEVLEGPS
jgi:hypothetical protein